MAPMAKEVEWVTVKVPKQAREQADKLIQILSKEGWKHFGINRDDPPTLGAVIEEGIRSLERAARK